ncbi:MAG: hypothetical protein B7Y39_19925, partial [Bdellovibrio sp. 28-41-41]
MKTKYIALYFLVGFLKPLPIFADTVSISFDNLKTLLESRNVKVEAYRLEVEAAKLKEGSLNRSFLPQLEFHASQENFKKGSAATKTQPAYGVEAKVNLFNGGKDSIESDMRDLNTQKKSVQLIKFTASELLEARTLFWEILYSQEKIALLESVSKINSQNTDSALKRIRSGVATDSDNLKQDLEMAKLQLKTQMDELRLMLNIDSSSTLQFPKEIGHEHDFEANIRHSHEDHDVLAKEDEIQSDLSQLSSQKFKRNWWPKVDAVAGYNQFNELEEDYPDAEQRKESYVGLRVSLSLSDGFESNKEAASQAKESAAFRKLAGYQRQQAHSHIENEVAELKLLHSQVHDAEENIVRAEKY